MANNEQNNNANKLQKSPEAQKSTKQSEKSKNRRRMAAFLGLTAICTVVSVLLGGVLAVYTWLDNSVKKGEDTSAGSIPQSVLAEQIPEYQGEPVVYGLIAGIDKEKDKNGNIIDNIGRTDMLMYLKFNTETGQANFLQIPRDMFVGEELSTDGTYKINNLYYDSEDPNNRMAPLLNMLYNQMKLPVDFYLTIDLDAMVKLVDHVQGVMVYVPQDLINTNKETGEVQNVMTKGWHKFSGKDAEYFLRHRESFVDQDISRLLLQRNFYAALFKQFTTLNAKDMLTWAKVLMVYTKVGEMSTMDIISLAIKTMGIKTENVTFIRPEGNGQLSYKGQAVFALNEEELASILNEYFRPEGVTVTAEEMNVFSLPPDPTVGTSPTDISTIGEVEAALPPQE